MGAWEPKHRTALGVGVSAIRLSMVLYLMPVPLILPTSPSEKQQDIVYEQVVSV